MFCSKCGKDCGEFRFCPHCGTQVSHAEEAPASWSVGMACPHCGGVELEGDKCAFCGAVLKEAVPVAPVDVNMEWDSYEIPYDEVCFEEGKELHFKKDYLCVKKKKIFLSEVTRIPYEQIIAIAYVREGDYFAETIRWRDNNGIESEIMVGTKTAGRKFFHLLRVYILKLLIPPTAHISTKFPAVDKVKYAELSQKVDLRDLFLRHVPNWDTAAKELGARCMLTPDEAQYFIRDLFEPWLIERYTQEPRLAARDYNYMDRYFDEKFEREWAARHS